MKFFGTLTVLLLIGVGLVAGAYVFGYELHIDRVGNADPVERIQNIEQLIRQKIGQQRPAEAVGAIDSQNLSASSSGRRQGRGENNKDQVDDEPVSYWSETATVSEDTVSKDTVAPINEPHRDVPVKIPKDDNWREELSRELQSELNRMTDYVSKMAD